MASSPIHLIEGTPPRATRMVSYGRYMEPEISRRRRVACYIALGLFTAVCGYLYGASGGATGLLIIPLGLLTMIAFWVMPELRYPPVRLLRSLLTIMLFLYLCWPDYIALVIGDLPWISATRLTCFPLMFVFMVCLFGSRVFRAQMADIIKGDRLTVSLFVAFIIYSITSIFFSSDPQISVFKFSVFVYAGVVPFFVAIYVFNTPGRVRILSYFLYVIAMYNVAIAIDEAARRALPWSTDIPSFLKIEDPQVTTRLIGSMRAASNDYRTASRFSTSIGLGEYLGFAFPFVLHLFFTEKSLRVKMLMALSVPPMFYVVLQTGSRLGFVCFISSILLYVAFQAILIWRSRPTNIFAPAILLMYPIAMVGFVLLALVWRRLHDMIFGGGAAQFSTQSRHDQWVKGIPMIEARPWGHGIGTAGGTLMYISPGSDFPTVDSFYLNILLDFGIPFFIVFFGMLGWSIGRSALAALKTKDPSTAYLAAIAVALTNFVISKSVYSQQENHTLAFILLGAAVALLRTYAAETGRLPPPTVESTLYAPSTNDFEKDWERRLPAPVR